MTGMADMRTLVSLHLTPSPCTQGEGGERVHFHLRFSICNLRFGRTLSPALSLRTGRGRKCSFALMKFRAEYRERESESAYFASSHGNDPVDIGIPGGQRSLNM